MPNEEMMYRRNADGTFSKINNIQPDIPLEVSGSASALNSDVIPQTDVSQIVDLTIQMFGTWSGTVTFQGSNDGVNWQSVIGYNIGSANVTPAATTGGNNLFVVPTGFKYFRARLTSYVSGTAQAVMIGNRQPTPMIGVGGAVNVNTLGAGSNVIGIVQHASRNSSGVTLYRKVSSADTNLASVKITQTALFTVHAINNAASARYIKIFNKTSAPVLGTDTPQITIKVPANSDVETSFALPFGVNLSAGLALAITANPADNDNTAVAAGDIILDIQYA